MALAARHHSAMLRLARTHVSSMAVAEEVVQDTWLGVLRGLDSFAGRSSFQSWLMSILVNRARSTGVREHRSMPVEYPGAVVDSSRFDASGAWASPPQHWIEDSENRVLAQAMAQPIQSALDELPPRQREVVVLRDIDGLSSREVCEALRHQRSQPKGAAPPRTQPAAPSPGSRDGEGLKDAPTAPQ